MKQFSDHRRFSWIFVIALAVLGGLATPASAQVAGTDADGDGVPDAVDNCPNDNTNGPSTLTDDPAPDAAIADSAICGSPGVALVRTIEVPAGDAILVDVNVVLDVAHTWYGDVRVTLEHAGTTVVLLLQQAPNDSSDLGGIYTMEDEAATTLDSASTLVGSNTVIVPGAYQGEELLSQFGGQEPQGVWTLTITDWCQFDTGTLRTWSLGFVLSDQSDSDGDGVGDVCDNCPIASNPANLAPTDCNGDFDTVDPGEGVGEQCDSDGDGLGDACEACPECDVDGDGVINLADVCCNTPAGVDVDAEGRPIGDLDGDCDNDLQDFYLFSHGVTGSLSEPADCP